ncbi:Chromosome segregation protein Spo0J, contains ParB-like nuclease domain [Amycolatopsis arida]|uniref:Chromosome segregation protein Spo0J, contains ParB-like nuclease domain n=1 Tax=Amycolatopsis arida TaxID=587909 RepID=A0A1I5V5Y5_9PSEU|nr:ParB N-terminal domain-containing protein [Amycolatopsis arida]TDX91159.1 ParB-like chromosome segregation protein Spo0J [Amycolatopsis arida]SFQ02792.1 Chromosome segregation protein Spo0J, contains ParB-like nuclease domain [Amycolatopsis arida]
MEGRGRGVAVADAARRPTELVPLDALVTDGSPRSSGADMAHARLLAESEADLPPILVNRRTMRVIDGAHRVLAATLRGQHAIAAQFFDCDDEEAFVLAVEANVAHGLPLSLAERTAAAERIIASHGEWSDRAIAAVTGLAHKTVGAIRRRSSGEVPQSPTRRGRDGRARPVDGAAGRAEAGRLLASRPHASLREIAREAGVCPATVWDVRARLARGEDPVPPARQESRGSGAGTGGRAEPPARLRPVARLDHPPADGPSAVRNLRRDPSLRFSESGRLLLRLLEVSAMGPRDWERLGDTVPTHCTEVVATVARVCGQAWHAFAADLEQRQRRRSG